MKWFSVVLQLLQFSPKILELIQQVEIVIGAGNGAVKKSIVMAAIAGAPPEVNAAASTFVDTVVAEQKKVTPPVVVHPAV